MTKKYSLGFVGRKAGMSRVFTEDGQAIPVTLIEATRTASRRSRPSKLTATAPCR